MNITIEQKEPCLIDLHIGLPPEYFEKEWRRIENEYQKSADMPGFRKGKAPRSSIEKKYARDIRLDVIEHLTEVSIKKALEEQQIKTLQDPEIKKTALLNDHSFCLLVTVMTHPEVKLEASDYSELEVIVEQRKYNAEKMTQDFLETMQQQLPEYINIEDRGLIMGDIALIDYDWDTKGSEHLDTLEDNPTFDESFISDYDEWHEMGEKKEYIPGFSKALLSMKPDEVRKFKITFPHDFHEKRLRGATVFYEVTLYAINVKEILSIDDNLANAIMPGHTLEELKQEANDSLQNLFEKNLEEEAKDILREKVIDKIPCDLPLAFVLKMKEGMIDDFIEKCQDDELSSEEIELAVEDFEPVAEEAAVRELRWMFIAQAIAEKESLELTQEEFIGYMEEIAEEGGLSLEDFLWEVKDNGEFSIFYGKAMEEKVLEFIYSQAKIVNVPATLLGKILNRKSKKLKK